MKTTTDAVVSNRLGARSLLRALDDGWQAYLPALHALDEHTTRWYLAAQGYEQTRDLLAHLIAWCEETLGVVPVLLHGGEIPVGQQYDDQSYNAEVVARFSNFGTREVERRFTEAYAALARMLAFLPDAALTDTNVYGWLYTTIVEHFNAHRLPNQAALPF